MRLDYLRKLAGEGRLWPRHQEARPEEFCDSAGVSHPALVTMEEIEHLRSGIFIKDHGWQVFNQHVCIASVSHVWESQQHPDPWGSQLSGLIKKIDAVWSHLDGFKKGGLEVDIWLFIDFISLPQYRRNNEEQELFQRSMRSMHVLYAHEAIGRVFRLDSLTPETGKQPRDFIDIFCERTGRFEPRPFKELVFNDTPYHQRGWCIAETQWMSTKSVVWGLSPMSPGIFQERVAQGHRQHPDGLVLKFTHRSDAELVTQLQAKAE